MGRLSVAARYRRISEAHLPTHLTTLVNRSYRENLHQNEGARDLAN